MTTTGAAKNRLLLESLKAKIGTYFFFFFFYIHSLTFIYWRCCFCSVIVEEAAEVLETHIVCSLTPDCQQLIMIGKVKFFIQLSAKLTISFG
jgi:hypothetical protein